MTLFLEKKNSFIRMKIPEVFNIVFFPIKISERYSIIIMIDLRKFI
jgi:hypothetical protein